MRILYIYPLKKFNIEHCCSVAKSCLTLWDPMYCSPPGLLVLHYLSKFAQVHVHWVSDAIQPSHPLMRYIIHTTVLILFTILYITPSTLAWKIHGQRSLVGCSPWGRKELDTTERLHFHIHFHALEKEMATHSSVLPGKSQGRWSLVGCCLWGSTESDPTEAT